MSNKSDLNLIYFKDPSINGNFGDELSKFITYSLIDKNKYNLIYNQKNCNLNIVCIGSYLHKAVSNCYVFGSGIRTSTNGNKYNNLNVSAVRGPLTKKFLENKGVKCPSIFGDPALLLPRFYKPKLIKNLANKIGIIPHKSNYNLYKKKSFKNYFYLISPTDKWENVIDRIYSCKYIISSSLHGLICSDAYNKPNLWLDEYKIDEGDFKFKDYFESQKRTYIKISSINDYDEKLLYRNGNKINTQLLIDSFPFKDKNIIPNKSLPKTIISKTIINKKISKLNSYNLNKKIENEDINHNDFITKIINNHDFITQIINNHDFITKVISNTNFMKQIVNNNDFNTQIVNNNYFMKQIYENFIEKLINNNILFEETIKNIVHKMNENKNENIHKNKNENIHENINEDNIHEDINEDNIHEYINKDNIHEYINKDNIHENINENINKDNIHEDINKDNILENINDNNEENKEEITII